MKYFSTGLSVLGLSCALLATPLYVSAESATQVKMAEQSAKQQLRSILTQLNSFSANFGQQVYDDLGAELQFGQGTLSVSKPNLVHWATKTPDESLIVSDGDNLWFYDPFVEQVSVYSLANAIANTPILLITSNDDELWSQYDVNAVNSQQYLITAKDANARVKTLEISFVKDSEQPKIAGFNIVDVTGQLSVIKLTDIVANETLPNSLFQFTVPEGVYVDDQR